MRTIGPSSGLFAQPTEFQINFGRCHHLLQRLLPWDLLKRWYVLQRGPETARATGLKPFRRPEHVVAPAKGTMQHSEADPICPSEYSYVLLP